MQGEAKPIGYLVSNDEAYWPYGAPPMGTDLYTADQLRQAVREERERCANACELSPQAIRLMASEMTAQEMRTVTAVLRGVAAAIRSGEGEMKG